MAALAVIECPRRSWYDKTTMERRQPCRTSTRKDGDLWKPLPKTESAGDRKNLIHVPIFLNQTKKGGQYRITFMLVSHYA